MRYLLLATAGKRKTLSNISFTVRSLCIHNGSNLDSILSNLKTCKKEKHSLQMYVCVCEHLPNSWSNVHVSFQLIYDNFNRSSRVFQRENTPNTFLGILPNTTSSSRSTGCVVVLWRLLGTPFSLEDSPFFEAIASCSSSSTIFPSPTMQGHITLLASLYRK